MPEISIIIPVYNAEKFLDMTLTSVLKQTFTDFEVICVNDGSTDNSWKILQTFAQKDKRIKIFNQENVGGSVSRNNALEKAVGKYVAFLDNDDIYHPQYLEILYKNIKEANADVSCCSYVRFAGDENYVFEDKNENNGERWISKNPFIDKFQKKKKIESLMWTKLYRADIFKNIKFSPKLPAINDLLLNVEVLLEASKIVVSKQKLVAYRIINTSQTMQKLSFKRLDEYKNLVQEIMLLSQQNPQYEKLLGKVAADYAYGLYVKDVQKKYSLKLENSLFSRIKSDLDFLIGHNVLKTSRLNFKKRFSLWLYRMKLQYCIKI